jgi:hypothetical protein
LQWKGFQDCQIGNFAGILREFLNGQDFGKSRFPKKIPQNSRCFEPLNHCYDCDLPDFIPIPVFFIGGGGVISKSLASFDPLSSANTPTSSHDPASTQQQTPNTHEQPQQRKRRSHHQSHPHRPYQHYQRSIATTVCN